MAPPPGSPSYLFVAGLMRAGTTLLYRLLNNHPQVSLTYEIDLFALQPLLWPSLKKGGWHQRLDFWNGALRRHGIDGKESVALLPDSVRDPGEAFAALGRAYLARKPGTFVGDKSIHYHDSLPDIARLLPNARFIILHRPMADIIDSVRRAGASNDYLSRARRRRLLFQRYDRMLEGVVTLRGMGRQVHELQYREMIKDPETACRGMCDFLGLPFAPEMLASNMENVSAIPEAGHHFNARHAKIGDVQRAERTELSEPAAARVRAYEAYWEKRFAGEPVRLAARSEVPEGTPLGFFAVRRRLDRLAYEAHRKLFGVKLMIYRYAPMGLLKWYRARAGYDPNGGG